MRAPVHKGKAVNQGYAQPCAEGFPNLDRSPCPRLLFHPPDIYKFF